MLIDLDSQIGIQLPALTVPRGTPPARPLTSEEFNGMLNQCIYVSATPADIELERAGGVIVEQVIRPTGLLDPPIDVRPCTHQVDDLVEEIQKTVESGDRVLVTTLTKRMAEELTKYLERINISTRYIHSDVKTLMSFYRREKSAIQD